MTRVLRVHGSWLCVLAFFLPYIGASTYRVDQLLGFAALLAVALRYVFISDRWRQSAPEVRSLWSHALFIIMYVVLRALISGGGSEDIARVILNFSYPAVGISLFILFNEDLKVEIKSVVQAVLWASLVVNSIALLMMYFPQGLVSQMVNEHYSGPVIEAYGENINLATYTLLQGRVSSLFAHPMALATFNVLIFTLSIGGLLTRGRYASQKFYLLTLGLSLGGGLATSSKTYIGTMLILVCLVLAFSGRGVRRQLSASKILAFTVLGMILFISVSSYFLNPWTAYWLNGIAHLDLQALFGTRFGPEGWVLRSGTLDEAFKPWTFFAGQGLGAFRWAWADCGWLEPILFGGIGFFLLFFSYPVRLAILHSQRRLKHPECLWHAAMIISLILCSVGVGVFLYPRSAALLFWITPFFLVQRDAHT